MKRRFYEYENISLYIPFSCPISMSKPCTILCIKDQYIMIQYSALQNCIVQYSVVQYNTEQLSEVYDKVQDKFIFNSIGVSSKSKC